MNLEIIESCNNNCPFCFQGEHKSHRQMTLGQIESIVNWYNFYTNGIGIIGGEPTLHPQLVDICKLITGKGYAVTVFSNLLCDSELIKELFNIYNFNLLINICHDDSVHELFLQTFNTVIERDLGNAWDMCSAVALGVTITGDAQYDNHNLSRMYELLELDKHHVIKNIRISHAIPSPKDEHYKINTNFGNTAIEMITKCKQINPLLTFFFDCAVNVCLFGKDNYNKLKQIDRDCQFTLACNRPVLDVSYDYKTKWCACMDKVYDIHQYCTPYLLVNQMQKDYFIASKLMEHTCDSKNCTQLECHGYCVGIAETLQKQSQNLKGGLLL